MKYIILITLTIFNTVMAKQPDKQTEQKITDHIIYKSTSDQLAICDFNAGKLSRCTYKKIPHNMIYAVNNDNIYMHDTDSNNYQLCKIREKKIVDCTLTLVDNFKANKIIALNSRLYLLGRTIRS